MIKLFPFQGVPSLAPFGPQLAPSGRDIILLLLPLVLPNHEPRRARAGEEGDDGRAYGHDEILNECLHVLFHVLFHVHKQYDFKLLILAIRNIPQMPFFIFPTGEIFFSN